MSLQKARRDAIDIAIAAGTQPKTGKSAQTTLRLRQNPGRSSYAVLSRADGSLTPAGAHYYDTTGAPAPSRMFDRGAPLVKKGSSDYVTTRNGKLALVRRLLPNGETHVTRLGKQFFRGSTTEYVVSVPVTISGTNAKGKVQNRTSVLPVDMLGIGRILQQNSIPEETRIARVKSHVLSQLAIRSSGGGSILAEVSGETFTYMRDGQWLISALSTVVQDGEAVTSAVMRAPLGAGPIGCAAFLPYPEHICDAAWESHDAKDKLCVPRQVAQVLNINLDEAISYFDDMLEPGWEDVGVTPLELKELCKRQGRAFFFLVGFKLLDLYEPPRKNRALKSIALTSWEGHAYLYNSARAVCARRLSTLEQTTPVKLASEQHSEMPPISKWKPWTGTPAPGYHFCSDLTVARTQLLMSGRSPKVMLKSAAAAETIGLRYTCVKRLDGTTGPCIVRELPPERQAIEEFIARLPISIEWCGEGIPGLTQKVLMALLKADRQHPSAQAKAKILAEQKNACNICGEGGELEWDHIVPLHSTCAGNEQVFQALCRTCHSEKTLAQGRQNRTLVSRVSKHVYREYIESARPPPLVWSTHSHQEKEALCELDVRRCRKNALQHCAYAIPILSPFDNIMPATPGHLADFNFVEISRCGKYSTLSMLPYVGPMWYHRVAVEFMLHHGLAVWPDIKWQLDAASRLPKETLTEPLSTIERAWNDSQLAKHSINSMIGLWASTRTHSYSVITSSEPTDCPSSILTRHFAYGEDEKVIDNIGATRVIDNASYRPLHDMIMHTEATRMAQLKYILSQLQVPPRAIKNVKTDALIFSAPAKRLAAVKAISELRFDQLHTLRRTYELQDTNQLFLDSHTEMSPLTSEDPVFRFSENGMPLQGKYEPPNRDVAPPTTLPYWRDLTEAEAEQAVMGGQSLLVVGAPGSGKSYYLRVLVKALRKKGKRVDIIAKTHCACSNFSEGAVTADQWVRQKIRNGGSVQCDVLVCEEITQMEVQLWADVCKFSLAEGVAFILCGDFNQFGAIAEHWAGGYVPAGALRNSDMLLDMCGSNRLTLLENKRSDQILYDFYTSLSTRRLADALFEARRLFPVTDEPPDTTLVISHGRRRFLNAKRNAADAPLDAEFFKAPVGAATGNGPQSCFLWPGLRMIGAGGLVKKGVFVIITDVTEDGVTLDNGVKLTREQSIRSIRLSSCLTYASVQGLTLEGRVRLDCTESNHFTWKHLYVGASRCTAHNLLEVV